MPTRPRATPSFVETLEPRSLFSGGAAAVVGYLPDYRTTDRLLSNLATGGFGGMTQVDYFSVVPDANGLLPGTGYNGKTNAATATTSGYTLLGSTSQLRKLVTAAHAANVKVGVAVGGAGLGTQLDAVVAGGSPMWQAFASSVGQFAAAHNLDGIDMDWEPSGLRQNDVANYGGLLAAMRAANPNLTLTAAVSAARLSVSGGGQSYILNAVAMNSLDKVNVMTYDLLAGDVAPTALSQSYLNGWGTYAQSQGVSKQKLLFGVPFYGTSGSSWNAVQSRTYADLLSLTGTFQSPTADSVTSGGVTWKYNGPATIAAKTAYAIDNGYGGTMAWEVGQDYFADGTTYNATYSLLPQIKATTAARTAGVTGSVKTTTGDAVSGATVYLDTNGNGQRDALDPSAVTNAAGTYAFSGLLPDTYAVRLVPPAGVTQTTPGGGAAVSVALAAAQSKTADFVVSASRTATSVTLAAAGPATSNATQAVGFTATLVGGPAEGETVVLRDAARDGVAVATATFANGAATLVVPAGTLLAGTHALYASYAGSATLAPAASATVTQTVELIVTGVTMRSPNGTPAGTQRSRVGGAVYDFSEPVTVAANAFSIAVHAQQTGTVPTLNWTAVDPAADGSAARWAVTFGGNGVVAGSIADGVYDLTANPAAVAAAGNPSVALRPRPAETFHRLFADADGNRTINFADFVGLQSVFGRTVIAEPAAATFDGDGNGVVDFADFVALQSRFGMLFA